MKKFILAILLIAAPVSAQQSLNTLTSSNAILKDFDSEVITVSTVSIGFTASKINPTVTSQPTTNSRAIRAYCQNTSANSLNYVTDGKTATNAIGFIVLTNTFFTIYGYDNITSFRAIRNAGADATIACTYSRLP